MKIKPLIFTLVIVLSLGLLHASSAWAQTTAAATTFNVSISQVELCSSAACVNPITVGSGASVFDIASAAVGASLGSFASLDTVPKGTAVSHVRVTMLRTLGIAGSTADPGNVGGTCGTDSGDATSAINAAGIGIIGGGGTVHSLVVPDEGSIGGQPAAGTYAAVGITLANATEMTFLTALTTPFVMGDVPPIIDVSFETAASLQSFDSNGGVAGGNCLMLPGPPLVNISVQQ